MAWGRALFKTGSSVPLWGIAGKVGYAVCCLASASVLAAAAFSAKVVNNIDKIGASNAIVSGPSVGEQNILLMGLESRTDWNGNILPNDILYALHAGSRQGVENGVGGNDTNTLILIHIPAGGKKAIGFSIPRDDWVTFPQVYDGQGAGKIDQAYGLALAQKEDQLLNTNGGKMNNAIAFAGNEAGRAAAVATVEQVTGVRIDHFAEVNLDGFYEVAQALGGIQVCLNHPVALDSYSGFYAARAGLQTLDARMALAFVRQRHGLLNGDLDRTHRQQAFIDSVIHKLKTGGVLGDIPKLNSLLSSASQYIITDKGWDLIDFSQQMRSLTSGNLSFRTLPITGYGTIDGQDVNLVNIAQIQQEVHQSFYAPPPPVPARRPGHPAAAVPRADPGKTVVDVYNGGTTQGLAGQVSQALAGGGYRQGLVADAREPVATTEVLYGAGAAGSGDALARLFSVTARSRGSVATGHVEIVLATGAGVPAVGSVTSTTSKGGATGAAGGSGSTPVTAGPEGGTVSAVDGIPCVN
jgi:LCP family protein required for cell wall assembly